MSVNIEINQLTKKYGNFLANHDISLKIESGSIHALVGENGAGKSTLMKMIFGLIKPTSGEILVNQNKVDFKTWNPALALKNGIGMVQQHFVLAENETVLDNLVIGVEKTGFGGLRKRAKEKKELETLMQKTGLELPLEQKVENLSIGQKSRIEILKVLYRNAKFLILDEPTSVLTPNEIDSFLNSLLKLKEQGKTILFVSHKLKEVFKIADTISVLRAGKKINTLKTNQTNQDEVIEMMLGRKLFLPKTNNIDKNSLKTVFSHSFHAQNLELKSNVITGIAGVEGNGQEELIYSLIENLKEQEFDFGFIPQDRHLEGLVLNMNLYENLRLSRHLHLKYSNEYVENFKFFSPCLEEEKKLLKDYGVKPNNAETQASMLSGGNQQKLIVARELNYKNQVLIAVHPTRGVDLGAIEFIHKKIIDEAQKCSAVLIVSSELEELFSLCHEIYVIYKSRLVAHFNREKFDEKNIGQAMLTGV
jgi:simple sugar transport system ATP-binding protein